MAQDSTTATIRAARRSDLDDIASLQARSILAFGLGIYGEAVCQAWAKIGVQSRHTLLETGQFFVAEQDGAIIGVAGWTEDSREPDCAWPRYVFVDPGVAGRGIGRQLMNRIETAVHAAERPRLMLWASLNAVAFYEALRYRSIKQARWPLADGIDMELWLMTKDLVPRGSE